MTIVRDMRMITPKRYVLIRQHAADEWEGIFHDGDQVVFRTERGPKFLVLQCVDNVFEHRGLPKLIVRLGSPSGPRAA
jgi:hypothetical protein